MLQLQIRYESNISTNKEWKCQLILFHHLKHKQCQYEEKIKADVRATTVTNYFNSEGLCLPVFLHKHWSKLTEAVAFSGRHDANPNC